MSSVRFNFSVTKEQEVYFNECFTNVDGYGNLMFAVYRIANRDHNCCWEPTYDGLVMELECGVGRGSFYLGLLFTISRMYRHQIWTIVLKLYVMTKQ